MSGIRRRRIGGAAVGVATAVLVAWVPAPVDAQDASIDIPLETVVRGPEGSEHLLASEAVPADLVGSTCTARAAAENQSSVHPGNDLVIGSDDGQLVLEDVEREPGVETVTEGAIDLGEELTVTLVMGPDGVFSAGMDLQVVCEPADTTTTTETTTPTTDTTSPPTTEETTTTTVAGTTLTTSTTTTTTSPPPTEETTTTGPPTTTSESTLPFTGIGGRGMGGAALAAVAAGSGLVLVTRRSAARASRAGTTGVEVEIEGVRVRLLRPDD